MWRRRRRRRSAGPGGWAGWGGGPVGAHRAVGVEVERRGLVADLPLAAQGPPELGLDGAFLGGGGRGGRARDGGQEDRRRQEQGGQKGGRGAGHQMVHLEPWLPLE